MNMTAKDAEWVHDYLVNAIRKEQTTITLGVTAPKTFPHAVHTEFGDGGYCVEADASSIGREEPLHLLVYFTTAEKRSPRFAPAPGQHLCLDREILASYQKGWDDGVSITRLVTVDQPGHPSHGRALIEMPPFTIRLMRGLGEDS